MIVGSLVLAALSPAFLTQFNLYVLLRSVCVSTIVAFAQMITLAVGQMNLSVGGLGGMVAILFGAMMSALGVSLWLAIPAALLSALRQACSTECLITPDQRLRRDAGDRLGLPGSTSGSPSQSPTTTCRVRCRSSATDASARFHIC